MEPTSFQRLAPNKPRRRDATGTRGHANMLKQLLIHVGAFNLSLAKRKTVGAGTPRGLAVAKKD